MVEAALLAAAMQQSPIDVVIIGAGFAGLAAAVRLAGAGLGVLVIEEGPRLGGRATAFTDRETGERVDNGQHVLFGCYRETYAFLRCIGTAELAPLQSRLRLTMADTDGRQATLLCPALPAPWHLVGGLLRWGALGLTDRLRALRLARFLVDVRRRGADAVAATVPDDQTVSDWLSGHGQSQQLRDWLWNPLAIAALNQSPEIAGAAPFVRVLGELFGPHPDDATIGLPVAPLDDLYAEPAREYIESSGGEVLMKSAARIVVDDGGAIICVQVGEREVKARAVISTVPWHAFGRMWANGVPPVLADIGSHAAAMASSPIVTVNLWLDGPPMTERFIGLVGGPMHWVFNKSALFGGSASHLSVVASGADDLAQMDNAATTDRALRHLRMALPALRRRQLVRSVVVREHRATFSVAPGGPPRPATMTALPGFFLAGDWTDTGLPGTIEGAVKSGHRAADAVLARRT